MKKEYVVTLAGVVTLPSESADSARRYLDKFNGRKILDGIDGDSVEILKVELNEMSPVRRRRGRRGHG